MCITSKYLSQHNTNNIKGTLCAAAYRTLGTDEWSYKYYRYDARGRVIKMWNYIAGLGWKITKYEYNSQNQLTKLEYQSESDTDYKRYIYNYDYAGRMHSVSTEDSGPPPDYNYEYAIYKYNQNSQVDSVFMNNFNLTLSYAFNNRNWITNCANSSSIFGYSLDYAPNGNVTNQTISGIYRNNFSNTKDVRSNFTYDKSNRLKKVERYNTKYFDLAGEYSFDPDGNFTSLTRSYNSDNFTYQYYSGTNRLKRVSGSSDQFTYDYNGNQTNDYINNNTGIKYDHRNLITEFTRQDLNQDLPITDITRYKYDEAGNRIRKTIYRSNDSNPPPLPEETEDLPSGWSITKDEYYSRDASGKEIAVYQSYNLDYWNVWGTGNEGRIKSTGMKYFYLKDHLGSIRAVINQNNVIVQAQDYDPWGHIARTWDSTSADYKFTGKEHDKESSYDYFGARYYDSRVGRWGSVDPLFEKHIQWTPYNYVLGNPMALIDPDGKDPRRNQLGSYKDVLKVIKNSKDKSFEGLTAAFANLEYNKDDKEKKGLFLYTRNEGIIDMKHFFAAADWASKLSNTGSSIAEGMVLDLGLAKEVQQFVLGTKSGFAPEDAHSNWLGAIFGAELNPSGEISDVKEFQKYLLSLDPINPNSEEISDENVYIPENEGSPELSKRSVSDFLFTRPFYGMDPKNHSKEVEFK